MADKKVFRVLITETLGFYIDIEANEPDEAKRNARLAIDSGEDPFEDDRYNTGYEIQDVKELDRTDAEYQGTIAGQ